MFHGRHVLISFTFRQSEQWRALASAVDGGEGRQAKFLRLLGVKSAGGKKKEEEKEEKQGKKGKANEETAIGKQGGGKGKGHGDVEAEERKLEAALEAQFEEGLKHRHHRHGGLGL